MIRETADRMERILTAVNLKVPDRVPVVPMMTLFSLRNQGVPQREGFYNPPRAIKALIETFDTLGGYDAQLQPDYFWPRTGWQFSWAPVVLKIPGRDLAEDEVLHTEEAEIMSVEDYDVIINRGWNGFLYQALPRIFKTSLEEIDANYKRQFKIYVDDVKTWNDHGVPVIMGAMTWSCMMTLSMCRTLTQFTLDLYRIPDKIEAVMDAMVPDLIRNVIRDTKATGIPWVFFPIERDCGFYYPLRIFERFCLPYLKQMVDAFVSEGLISILHLDQNWGLNLPYLRDLPKGKCICELDSCTDIFKAKEILKGHMCIMGDVPASLLSYGTPEQVTTYCKKLIDIIGDEGGFILSTGCECPVDAKFDNVKAMIYTAKSHPTPRSA